MKGRAAVAAQAGPGPAAPPAADPVGVLQQLLTAGVGLAANIANMGSGPHTVACAQVLITQEGPVLAVHA